MPPDPAARPARSEVLAPVGAGIVSGLVAFTSSFVVVLAGLTAVGATPAQAAGGLLAASVSMGLGSVILSIGTRVPITIAWSTPGAALLAATGAVAGGWPAAVGAFMLTGVLILLTGMVPALGALMARIPTSIAQAMLAGVLLPLCLGPVLGLSENPHAVAPVVIVWALASRFARRWAAPLALLAAAAVITLAVVRAGAAVSVPSLLPSVSLTVPALSVEAVVGIALPLYLVTMASQNIPGVAVMRGLGYEIPWRGSLGVTGLGTVLAAPLGSHAINLAAITAALAAGPEAGEDRGRRWIASLTSGVVMVLLGLGSAAGAEMISRAPAGVIPAVAGLALLGTFAAALRAAVDDEQDRIPAVLTLLIAASAVTVGGISAAFWALVGGLGLRALLRRPAEAR